MVENNWIRSTEQLLPDPSASVDTFHIDYVRVWQGAVANGLRSSPPSRARISEDPAFDAGGRLRKPYSALQVGTYLFTTTPHR